ncbi:MAG: hypothetical protein DRG25_00445 [Deltaproteobacteria bacterium]|nr:MAG: hypothetical protein DRG25_00445 [Deltaproteobacteria bacterium]
MSFVTYQVLIKPKVIIHNLDSTPRVSIVIVTWNSLKHILRCLDCLSKQTYKLYEVIVVDNDSRDGTVEYVKRNYPQIKVVQNEENVGFAKANNQGIRLAQGEFILLLNPDVFPEPSFIEELMRVLSQRGSYGSAGGKLLLYENGKESSTIDSTGLFLKKNFRSSDRGNLKEDQGQYNQEEDVFAICGAAVLFRREALEKVSISEEYLDEDFFAYYEDLDIGWRMQLIGYKCVYTPKAKAYHVRGGSGLGAKFFQKDLDTQRLTLRNRYLMLIKNLSLSNLLFFSPYFFLTELTVMFYICIRSPRLLRVYLDVTKNLAKSWKKRSFIQSSRIKDSRYIRYWIKRAP